MNETKGAILITKYPTYRENAERMRRFKSYINDHHDSWVSFAESTGHDTVKPILVTGTAMTLDFAMLAYSHNFRRGINVAFHANPPAAISPAPVWGEWQSMGMAHHNCGPLSRTRGVPGQGGSDATDPRTYNQCVFLRYYSIYRRLFIRKIRAGAGPHDLGSGDNTSGNRPGTMEHYGALHSPIVALDTSPFSSVP